MREAYLQSSELFDREIFLEKPLPEFKLRTNACLQLMKLSYGLCESEDLWHTTLDRHHRKDLGMTPLRSYKASYTTCNIGILQGISGGYVYDLIREGEANFKSISSKTNVRFDIAEDHSLPCTFTGFPFAKII